MEELLQIKTIKNHILELKINRPKVFNSITNSLLIKMQQTLLEIRNNPKIRLLIIRGSGDRAFAAGADLESMASFSPEEAKRFSLLGQTVFQLIEELNIPTVSIITGYALGGGLELALATDLRIATENASFGFPEVTLGIIPGFGGTQRIVRAVGYSNAIDLVCTGRRLEAKEALRMGLVNMIVPKEDLEQQIMEYALRVLQVSSQAVRSAKESIRVSMYSSIETGMEFENSSLYECCKHRDKKEGMRAFLEKRKPEFE